MAFKPLRKLAYWMGQLLLHHHVPEIFWLIFGYSLPLLDTLNYEQLYFILNLFLLIHQLIMIIYL